MDKFFMQEPVEPLEPLCTGGTAPSEHVGAAPMRVKGLVFAEGNVDKAPEAVGDAFSGFTKDNTYFIYTDAVNMHGAAGGGIAGMYARRYPNMDALYRAWCFSLEGDRYSFKYNPDRPVMSKEAHLAQTVICDGPGNEKVWDEYSFKVVEDGYEDVEVPYYSGRLYDSDLVAGYGLPGDGTAGLESDDQLREDMLDDLDLDLPLSGSSKPVRSWFSRMAAPAGGPKGLPGKRTIRRKKYRDEVKFLGNDGVHKAMFIMNTMPALSFGIRDSYEAIAASMEGFIHTRYEYSASAEQVHKVLVIPAVGCGIGGCSWMVVKPLLVHYAGLVLANRDVTQIDGVIIVEPCDRSTDMDRLTIKQIH